MFDLELARKNASAREAGIKYPNLAKPENDTLAAAEKAGVDAYRLNLVRRAITWSNCAVNDHLTMAAKVLTMLDAYDNALAGKTAATAKDIEGAGDSVPYDGDPLL